MKQLFFKFPSINTFGTMVGNVKHKTHFVGVDENGVAIYDKFKNSPKLTLVGTTKVHGTNACIVYDVANTEVYFQSRSGIITKDKDNAGFATYMSTIEDSVIQMINEKINSMDLSDKISYTHIAIYGEWCGGNIQKGENLGIAKVDKRFIIFKIALININSTKIDNNGTIEYEKYWFTSSETLIFSDKSNKIYNIYEFETFEIEVDFNNIKMYQNQIIDMTIDVENECPVSKGFGFSGIGEGIVFHIKEDGYNDSKYWFKSKGEKHAKGHGKVKPLREVDVEKMDKLQKLAQELTPTWRLEQAMNETFDILNGGYIERKKFNNYFRWIIEDVKKECTETIKNCGFELKDVASYISKIASDYIFLMEKEQNEQM